MTHAILIASADAALNQALPQMLAAEAYTWQTVPDAARLLERLTQGVPDLILLDDTLPGVADSCTLCHALRTQPDTQSIPIIVMLAHDDDSLIANVLDAGATDYLVLPLRLVVVRQRLRHLLHISHLHTSMGETEARYRIISSMISDYAYAYNVNPDGTLVKQWSTKAFQTITGYSPDELNGDGWSSLIHPDDNEVTLRRYHRLMNGEQDSTEFRIITKSGQVRWLLDHGQPVFDERVGRIVRIYGAAQDITERKLAEQMLLNQTVELQTRNQELDAFAHTVAHDLKNPIASMMGFASLILSYGKRMTVEDITDNLNLIMESGYKLKAIINSLLLLASVSKQEVLTLTSLDMERIVDEAIQRLLPMITEQHAVIIHPHHSPVAVGYAPWVEEVWANYLSNALKYGGSPPCVEFGADAPADGMVRFWMIDNGTGLTPQEQRQVFTPFTRLSQAKIEGHGLGLSVVQRIVEKLGGVADVETAYTGGCKFSFTLPIANLPDA
ncbi:MAG: PAS domain S-box protein [Armatimonadetes bacterium]|nr:PAS domain S-box protein [Anaerolineae bacterium]